ncbi:hypothetical protein SAY86_020616 [Trapa natans]|uniref:Uncharacterized protein n=1 Tax=Trapa natans TaxID=22666 RepID=A0AAN7LNN5_TRANT|nr:hypothetical protein SAY86_020616 [Trapa natans]
MKWISQNTERGIRDRQFSHIQSRRILGFRVDHPRRSKNKHIAINSTECLRELIENGSLPSSWNGGNTANATESEMIEESFFTSSSSYPSSFGAPMSFGYRDGWCGDLSVGRTHVAVDYFAIIKGDFGH